MHSVLVSVLTVVLAMTGTTLATPLGTPVPDGWHSSDDKTALTWLRDGSAAIFGPGSKHCDIGGPKLTVWEQHSALLHCSIDFKTRGQWTPDGRENDYVCEQNPSIRWSMNNWGFKDPKACLGICQPCIDLAMQEGHSRASCQFNRNFANCHLTYKVSPVLFGKSSLNQS